MSDLHVVHSSNKMMRCVFNSLVIRNDSLNAMYPGGFKGFIEKHGDLTNRDITMLFSMADEEIEDAVRDLRDNGLSGGEDYTFVDAGGYSIHVAMDREQQDVPHTISVGVDWLGARYAEGGIWLWYTGR